MDTEKTQRTESERTHQMAPGKSAREATLQKSDLDVLAKLHHSNQQEVELGRLAERSATSKQVKSYGERLVKDHQSADQQLMSLAKKHGAEIGKPQPKDQAERDDMQKQAKTVKELKTLKGDAFDGAFTANAIEEHQKDIQAVQTARDQVESQDVKDLLDKMLPVLKEHLRMAEQLSRNPAS
jgi:putative membrane protein